MCACPLRGAPVRLQAFTRPIRQIDTAADYDVTVPGYGVAHSPLVEGELLITLLGGEPDAMVVAFDKARSCVSLTAADYE